MRKILIILLLILITNLSYAKISTPPVLKDEPISEQQYLKTLYDNWNKLEVVTTSPDGSRKGNFGDMLLLNNSGTYYLEICTSSPNGTVWKGIQLTDTP